MTKQRLIYEMFLQVFDDNQTLHSALEKIFDCNFTASLPATVVSRTYFCDETVSCLMRRGLIDEFFFKSIEYYIDNKYIELINFVKKLYMTMP